MLTIGKKMSFQKKIKMEFTQLLISILGVVLSALGVLLFHIVTNLKRSVDILNQKMENSNLLEYRIKVLESKFNK